MIERPAGLRIIEIDPVCSLGELDRCLLVVWRQQPTRAMFDLRHRALTDLASRHAGQCAYVELIESTSKPPPDELRKVAVEVFRKLGNAVSCVGFVMEGNELRTALVRAILTGMTFLVPQMQPSKVFKRAAAAAAWVRPQLGGAEPELETRLTAAIDYLRRARDKALEPPESYSSST
ncbi:MAG: hypothetical protein ABI467_01510 [Kofleriaceae bacterium]